MRRREFLTLAVMIAGISMPCFAADVNPTGTWKWSVTNPNNNQAREQTLTLKLDGDKLTGGLAGPGARKSQLRMPHSRMGRSRSL